MKLRLWEILAENVDETELEAIIHASAGWRLRDACSKHSNASGPNPTMGNKSARLHSGRSLFWQIMQMFPNHEPTIDMFANPSNTTLPLFCSRWPHARALLVDAPSCPLSQVQCVYVHPQWSIMQQWLVRLGDFPWVTVLPFWISMSW